MSASKKSSFFGANEVTVCTATGDDSAAAGVEARACGEALRSALGQPVTLLDLLRRRRLHGVDCRLSRRGLLRIMRGCGHLGGLQLFEDE